jgi:hypothetical protein
MVTQAVKKLLAGCESRRFFAVFRAAPYGILPQAKSAVVYNISISSHVSVLR